MGEPTVVVCGVKKLGEELRNGEKLGRWGQSTNVGVREEKKNRRDEKNRDGSLLCGCLRGDVGVLEEEKMLEEKKE